MCRNENSSSIETQVDSIVVMAGPMPPCIGGMTACINGLLESKLKEKVCFKTFDTSKQTKEGRTLVTAIFARCNLLIQWWKIIGDSQSTVVHIHTCSGLSFFLDGLYLLIARMRKTPVILHIHGGRFDQFLDQLNPLLRSFAGFLARRASKLVVLSDEWEVRISARIKGANIAVVRNGVFVPEVFHEKKNDDVLNLLFLGVLNKNKGILELVDAMQNTPSNIRLFVVGAEGESGFSNRVKNKIKEYRLQDKVLLTGPLQGQEKQYYIDQCQVFLMPSYYEGLPIALLEAMAAGLSVVVSPVGSIPFVARNDIEALHVEAGDAESIHKAILTMYENIDLRKKLAKAAYTRCSDKFSIDAVADIWFKLYLELVNKGAKH